MNKTKSFPFEQARRITPVEVEAYRDAIKVVTGKKPRRRPGRPPTPAAEKTQPVSIRLHPIILKWAKKEAHKRGVGYQTFINDILLKKAVA